MPDQPAPDFEEAQELAKELASEYERIMPSSSEDVTVPAGSILALARAYLALLSEREARDEDWLDAEESAQAEGKRDG